MRVSKRIIFSLISIIVALISNIFCLYLCFSSYTFKFPK